MKGPWNQNIGNGGGHTQGAAMRRALARNGFAFQKSSACVCRMPLGDVEVDEVIGCCGSCGGRVGVLVYGVDSEC